MALVNPNIAMSVKPLEVQFRNPMAEAAQVMNVQQAQMQMEKLRQTDEAIERIRQAAVKNGGPGDLNEIAQAFLQSPDLGHQQLGLKIRQQQSEKADFERTARALGYTDLFPAAPGAAAPAAAPTAPAQPGAMGSGTFGITPAPATNALAPAPTAPANQLAPVPPAAPVANALVSQEKTPDQLRREIMLFGRSNDPSAKNMVDILKNQLTEALKTTTVSPGQEVFRGGKVVYSRGENAPSSVREFEAFQKMSPAEQQAFMTMKRSGQPQQTVQLPPQEKAFEAELGKGQAERLIKSQAAAQDAASIIDTVKTGRDIMKSGMITGAGANFLVNLNQALKTAGIDAGYADAAANSQAFAANMAGNVGKLIKQFGAGTGLSDADREFAKDMAGGRISLDPKAIDKILTINEKAARNVIARHNKDIEGVKTNIPLKVDMPPETPAAPGMAPPAAAIEYLRANPTMRGAFDAKYGAGAAARALGGQ